MPALVQADNYCYSKQVTDILHQVFDRMRSVEENEIISRTHRSAMVSLKKRLADAKAESAKATKEYESLKLEIHIPW